MSGQYPRRRFGPTRAGRGQWLLEGGRSAAWRSSAVFSYETGQEPFASDNNKMRIKYNV